MKDINVLAENLNQWYIRIKAIEDKAKLARINAERMSYILQELLKEPTDPSYSELRLEYDDLSIKNAQILNAIEALVNA